MTTNLQPTSTRTEQPTGRWATLAVLLLGQFMALLDVTIVNVAMPTIRTDLHASGAALQLVVSMYTISYAMLLITGARLGDLFGRRRIFVGGVAAFTISSLLCGLAPDPTMLIAARFVQGAGAALMMPQIISVIQLGFSGAARTKALSAYSAVISVGGVAGMVIGGVLVHADLFGAGWRPVFLINVPIGLVVIALVPRFVPADQPSTGRRLDLAGLVVLLPATFLIVLPLVLGHEQNWPAWMFPSIAVGLVLVAVFVRVERRVAARGGDPLLNLDVLRARGFGRGLVALATAMITYGGMLFVLALHLQSGLGESTLQASLVFAPAGAAFGIFGYYWRRLPARTQPMLIPVGFLLTGAAYVLLAFALRDGSQGSVGMYAGLVLFGAAMGCAFGSLTNRVLADVPPGEAADASGLLTTTFQFGQVLGVATFGSAFLSLADGHSSAVALSTAFFGMAVVVLAGFVTTVARRR
ncbi:MFS transporter [Actinocrispum wychmicini]|nr:MFS transporter [Actinocrispum wychmicini]